MCFCELFDDSFIYIFQIYVYAFSLWSCYLSGVYRERLQDLRLYFKEDLQKLEDVALREEKRAKEKQVKEEENLTVTMFTTDYRMTDAEMAMKGEFVSRMDEIKNKVSAVIHCNQK